MGIDIIAQKLDFYTEKAKSLSNGKSIRVFGTSIWDETLYLVFIFLCDET